MSKHRLQRNWKKSIKSGKQNKLSKSPEMRLFMCSFFQGPKTRWKNHIVGFGMHIDHAENKGHVFDAGLYRCTAPDGVNPDEFFAPFLGNGYDCNYSPVPFPSENCGTFEFQWTIGGKITLFPDNLGLPLGRDDGTVEYFMTEVHYENPDRRSDLKIRAGFNVYYTPSLRPTEIGQIQLAFMTNKTFSLTIPPNSEDFLVSSHCPMECT
ncbi:DBH-like monooxygenase protein 1 homolog [Folsomia candida]|uniref:DBH-like monooxygenase protein 1 homolog n=1 Tax=Folsomia candida TaxID=158441 RepID=UPI0016050FFB|nr:DBH-like monooxygenase protein 1 homolog [Folsomia candida]